MSLHEDVTTAIAVEIESLGAAIALSPTSLARAVLRRFSAAPVEPHIEYASLEHLKQMARRVLAGRYETDGEDNETHQAQLFSGHLQDRYPVPPRKDCEPTYKALSELDAMEIAWNVAQLRKSADARRKHADALEAWAASNDTLQTA